MELQCNARAAHTRSGLVHWLIDCLIRGMALLVEKTCILSHGVSVWHRSCSKQASIARRKFVYSNSFIRSRIQRASYFVHSIFYLMRVTYSQYSYLAQLNPRSSVGTLHHISHELGRSVTCVSYATGIYGVNSEYRANQTKLNHLQSGTLKSK